MAFDQGVPENPTPVVYTSAQRRNVTESDFDNSVKDEINAMEVYDLIRGIKDPEHSYTLEQLRVVSEEDVTVDNVTKMVEVVFTPTISGCSLASLIGLCLQVKLLRSLPAEYKISVKVAPRSHDSEESINKQLADKERVAAALENDQLLQGVNKNLVDSL